MGVSKNGPDIDPSSRDLTIRAHHLLLQGSITNLPYYGNPKRL